MTGSEGAGRFFLLLFTAFILGYVLAVFAQLSLPTFTILQINATYWQGNGTVGLGTKLAYGTPPSTAGGVELGTRFAYGTPPSTAGGAGLGTKLVYGVPPSAVGEASLTYQLKYYISYGGVFHVDGVWIPNPVTVGKVGANKAFIINVTVWSPYGMVNRIELNISGVAKYLYNGSLYETYDPNNLFEPIGYSFTANRGWIYFTLELKPSWNAGGNYDVWVYAEDLARGYTNSSLYASLFSVINRTILYDYSFNKTVFFPNDPARLTLYITYNNTSVGAEGETLWVNGTRLITDALGVAYYDFTVPSTAGDYVLNVTLAHGKTYYIHFTVSKIILHLYTRTAKNRTIHLPSDLLIKVYNYTTGELLRECNGKEIVDIPLDVTGVYLIRVYYHGITIAETVHNQTWWEQSLILMPIEQVVDHLGKLRGLLSNTTLVSISYDNSTRKLHVELGGSGVGRLVYIVNYTKPLLVLSNTTILNEQHLGGEVIIDVELPANVTIIDPRRLKVVVENPFKLSYVPIIKFLNGTIWKILVNNTLYEVPAYPETQIVVVFKDVEVKKVVPLVDDLNLTVILPYVRFSDYRGIERELVANTSIILDNLSPKFPYSSTRMLISGTGGFKIKLYLATPPSKLEVVSNTTITWTVKHGWLIIEGTLHGTAEVNVTDLYKLRVELYDRLGNLMPSWIYTFINQTKYSGAVIEDYYYPENYVIKLPTSINGFEFYGFFDGFNKTVRTITINRDTILKAWYRVPTTIEEVKGFQVTSQWWVFTKQDNGRVEVYIEGYLRDYYGNGVPNRLVVINITDTELGFTWTINVTTDATGYWRTPLLELVRGKTYRIDVTFSGDDVYVGSYSTMEVKPKELPTTFEIPIEYLIVVTILVTVGVVAVLRATRHAIEDLYEESRRFVKRKG